MAKLLKGIRTTIVDNTAGDLTGDGGNVLVETNPEYNVAVQLSQGESHIIWLDRDSAVMLANLILEEANSSYSCDSYNGSIT